MSIEGGLSTKEYGGAHEKHANGFDVNNISVSENNSEKTRVFCEKNSADQILSFQDGDIEIVEKDIDTDSENLQFLAGDELDSFRTDSQTNSEWLKNQCRNVDNVNFDIESSSSDDDLFEASVGELAGGEDSGISLCVDVSASQMFISPLNHSIFSTCETSLVTPSSSVQSSLTSVVLTPDNVCGGTAPSLQDSLDVVSEMTSSMDTISANPTVMASQSMSFPVGQQTVTNVMNQLVPSSDVPTESTVLLAPVNANQPQLIQATAIPQTIQVISPQPTVIHQGNLKFATISISTDKPSNSTHILVNTNQGNQLYKLNTADLKHATNVVKSLDGSDSQQSTTNPQTGYTQYFQFDRFD